MEKYLTILRARRTGTIIAMSIVLALGTLSLMRLYPFGNSFKTIYNGVDDWRIYARLAVDIKHNGILIPSLEGNYLKPAGFLYNYFLALCFYIFGENTIPVFIVQSLLLGLSIVFIYWAFRDKMKPLTGLAFLLTLFIFALLDIYKYYSFRLLSENLAVFTISVFFFFFFKGIEKNKLSLQLLAAFFLGISILTRPNIFPFGIVAIIILFYFLKQKKSGMLNLFLFALILILCTSLLALRNHFVYGGWAFLPSEGVSFGMQFFQDHFSFCFFLKKIAFCFGALTPLEPEYQWRPHWIIMWSGYFVYLYFRIKENKKLELWEITTHLFIFSYYGVLILIAPQLGTYGFRLLIPVLFIVLPFSFMALDKLKK